MTARSAIALALRLVLAAAAPAAGLALAAGPAPAPAATPVATGAIAAATPTAAPASAPSSPSAERDARPATPTPAAADGPGTPPAAAATDTRPNPAPATSRSHTGQAAAASTPDSGSPSATPTADYAPGSPQRRFFDQLNADRQRCGFGPLAQSKALDAAAAAHVRYMLLNEETGHDQTPGRPGFSGRGPGDRALAAGFGAANVAEIGESLEAGYPGLMSAPYHALLALWSFRAVGVAHERSGSASRLWAKLGWPPGTLEQLPQGVVTYPCEGVTGVLARSGREIPSPFPGEEDQTWGQPVVVRGTAALRVHAVRIQGPAGAVPLRALYGDGQRRDPNGFCTQGWACAIPRVLQPSSRYHVVVEGEDQGQPFRRSFAFETGPQ